MKEDTVNVVFKIKRDVTHLLTKEGIENALNFYIGSDGVVTVKAVEHRMHLTAFGVLLVVFFIGFGCGAVVFNGLCGGW